MKKKRYNLKVKITLSLRPDVVRRLDEEAEAKFLSRSQAVENVLRQYFLGVIDNGIRQEKDTENEGGER